MNKDNNSTEASIDPDREIQAIFDKAGAPHTPDEARKSDSRAQLRQVWQQTVSTNKRKQRWRTALPIGLVASIAIVGLIVLRLDLFADPILGQIVYAQGEVQHTSKNGDQLDTSLFTGHMVVTPSDALVTLKLADTTVLQLGPSTQVTIQGESDVWLHYGKIYVDSSGTDQSILIRTPLGEIRDIGTQFEVSLDENSLELAMREGTAELQLADNTSAPVVAASRNLESDLILVEAGGLVTRGVLSPSANRWGWTRQGTPDHPAGEHTLASIVKWAARHTGREIAYDSPMTLLQTKSERVVWPTIKLVTAESQLAELIETSNFELSFSDTKISVSTK